MDRSGLEVLTPAQMAAAERHEIEAGRTDGMTLMRRAAAAVADVVLQRMPEMAAADVLCGPGNNGGDGYCVAERLKAAGLAVRLWALAPPRPGSDAERAAAETTLPVGRLVDFRPAAGAVVIDALFGAGLSRGLEGEAAACAERCTASGARVIAVDLPSGVAGETGKVHTVAFRAEATVTFERAKIGHLLLPGSGCCGDCVVADIGLGAGAVRAAGAAVWRNDPAMWRALLPDPGVTAHKYNRGHVAVFSGGPLSTGAARLSAHAAARTGAGAVTVLSPPDALAVNAAHLTSIMLAAAADAAEAVDFLRRRKVAAAVIGPGFGVGAKLAETVTALLAMRDGAAATLVLDADALTAFRDDPQRLFAAIRAEKAPNVVLTPHEGEFARLFPDLAGDDRLSKLDRARQAAARSGAVVLCKGADTVIAMPTGDAVVSVHGTPYLATAGSGDVLTGIIAGLAAQGMETFAATSAAAWLHGEAGRRLGRGLIADDLPDAIPQAVAAALRRDPAR